jgi:hypothetical protein
MRVVQGKLGYAGIGREKTEGGICLCKCLGETLSRRGNRPCKGPEAGGCLAVLQKQRCGGQWGRDAWHKGPPRFQDSEETKLRGRSEQGGSELEERSGEEE